MTTVDTAEEAKVRPYESPPGGDGSNGKGWPDPGDSADRSYKAGRLGMLLALAAIFMLFIALTSALIVRQGLSNDWQAIRAPWILWPNTFLLLMSSLTLEAARRALKRGTTRTFSRWLLVTTALGIVFLVGQIATWQQLAAQGIYVATGPHSSFFYLLTGAHSAHLLGGVLALIYLTTRAWMRETEDRKFSEEFLSASSSTPTGRFRYSLAVDLTALYWHFMDGLWVYLLVLLFMLS